MAAFIGLLLGAWFLPWWLVVAFMVGAILFYEDFFEAIVITLYFDLVYGSGLAGLNGYFLPTISCLVFILLVEAFRKYLLMRR